MDGVVINTINEGAINTKGVRAQTQPLRPFLYRSGVPTTY